jgi:hypothetical protein
LERDAVSKMLVGDPFVELTTPSKGLRFVAASFELTV